MPPITSTLNKPIVLRGASAATVAALHGQIVHESEIPFQLNTSAAQAGTLVQQVIRSNGSGLLTFAYSIALTDEDHDGEVALAIFFKQSGLSISFADFRADSSGITAPNHFESSPMEGFSFKFNHGLAARRATRTCFIATNARDFTEDGGTIKLIAGRKSVALAVAAPRGTAPTRFTEVNRADDIPPASGLDAETDSAPEPSNT